MVFVLHIFLFMESNKEIASWPVLVGSEIALSSHLMLSLNNLTFMASFSRFYNTLTDIMQQLLKVLKRQGNKRIK